MPNQNTSAPRQICEQRRRFLKWLAASPLAVVPMTSFSAPYLVEGQSAADVASRLFDQMITSPDQALSLFDFERVASMNLPPAHFGYLASATDDGNMRTVNRAAFDKFDLRMTRLHGQGRPDLSVELFGEQFDAPFFMCPVSSLRAFHPEGELAMARAARATNIPMSISTFSSTGIEQVNQAYGQPVWFQLYLQSQFEASTELVQRAEQSGSKVLLFTVDSPARSTSSVGALYERLDTRDCTACHNDFIGQRWHKPMVAPLSSNGMPEQTGPFLDWSIIDRLRNITDMKIVVKGIETQADAEAARSVGVDAVYVSNHGGRVMHSGRAALNCLPEVVAGAGQLPVLIDSGFRRGSDVFKALALGATAVGFGRPFIWGMAAFGQEGAEKAVDMVMRELRTSMIHAGAGKVQDIHAGMLS